MEGARSEPGSLAQPEPATPAPSLQGFLGSISAEVQAGLLPPPTLAPTGPTRRTRKKPDPDTVPRRSDRLAGKPCAGTVLSMAQKNICRKLGEEFEEPVVDHSALLTRYTGCFGGGPLNDLQIKVLTDLALHATAGRRSALLV